MSTQEAMKAKLESSGLPFKEIKVYGSQIVVTAWSREAALKWASFIAKFATVFCGITAIDECRQNDKLIGNPSVVEVFRVFARISCGRER